MEFRHLKRFVTLAETLNFRRAADKLHMSQPPLSVSIGKLEADLGVKLFIRGKSGVRLTESGEAALADARKALFHAKQFARVAQAASMGDAGMIRVGFVGSATHTILPRILMTFRDRFPDVQLVLREATSIRIMEELEQETLDVGIVRIPVSSRDGARMLTLEMENFVLAMQKNHPRAHEPSIKLSDLVDEDFILYTAADAVGLRMAAIHACQLRGFTPKVSQEAVQVQTVLSLVEAGLGVALVPSISRLRSEQIVYKPLSDLPASASIGIALTWNPAMETPVIRNFTGVSQEIFNPSY